MTQDIDLGDSLWAHTAPPSAALPQFEGNARAKVAVIGGGYTGCVAALHLASRGVDVVLLEAKEIGWGGSGRNAGLVNAGLWVNPSAIIDHYGEVHGANLIEGLGNAPALVRELIERHGIDCDPGRKGIVKAAHSTAAVAQIAETVRQWRELGAPVELLDAASMASLTGTARYPGGLVDHRSFTIEPLAYARGLAAVAVKGGARLFTQSPVRALKPLPDAVRVSTDRGEIVAGKVIVATGAYDTSLIPGMARGFVPVGYFMFATEPVSHNLRQAILPGKAAVFDTSLSLLTLRYDRDYRLIVGNLGWLPSAASGHNWARTALRSAFPQVGEVRFTRGWGGTLDFTDDHMPWLSRPMPGVHMVGGYNGRGIGPGAFWGDILAQWVMGLPEQDLPVPVGPLPSIHHRWAKQHIYANGFRAYRLLPPRTKP